MPKGVKYNLKFKTYDKEYIIVENLKMPQLCEKVEELFEAVYDITDIKVSRHSVYNLHHRPHKTCRLLRHFCAIEKCGA